jgi:DNA-binding GntR family transcriptional regulator
MLALSSEQNARSGLAQHRAILRALQARDAKRAVALAEEHDQSSIRHLRSRISPGPSPVAPPEESGGRMRAARKS